MELCTSMPSLGAVLWVNAVPAGVVDVEVFAKGPGCFPRMPVGAEVSAEAFFGFTDGTTVWAASVSDRGMEPFMSDYKAPLDSASGSVLNPFGPFVSAVQAAESFTVR